MLEMSDSRSTVIWVLRGGAGGPQWAAADPRLGGGLDFTGEGEVGLVQDQSGRS